MSEVTERKNFAKETMKNLEIIKPWGCNKPCYFHKHHIEHQKGAQGHPYHWIINTGGYPMLNIVMQFRGVAGKYYQVQIRHHHPSASIGPTATFVFANETGTLGPAGFELVTFSGLRPYLPEVDIIAFSNDNVNFDTVVSTVYATT